MKNKIKCPHCQKHIDAHKAGFHKCLALPNSKTAKRQK